MPHHHIRKDGPRLILRSGNLPRPVGWATLIFALALLIWVLAQLAQLIVTGPGLRAVMPLGIATLPLGTVAAAFAYLPLWAELTLDPMENRADLRKWGLIRHRRESWPLATLSAPQISYDKGSTDSLPCWTLQIPLPGPRPKAFVMSFHFNGQPSVAAHLAREKATAEALQTQITALIAASRAHQKN